MPHQRGHRDERRPQPCTVGGLAGGPLCRGVSRGRGANPGRVAAADVLHRHRRDRPADPGERQHHHLDAAGESRRCAPTRSPRRLVSAAQRRGDGRRAPGAARQQRTTRPSAAGRAARWPQHLLRGERPDQPLRGSGIGGHRRFSADPAGWQSAAALDWSPLSADQQHSDDALPGGGCTGLRHHRKLPLLLPLRTAHRCSPGAVAAGTVH